MDDLARMNANVIENLVKSEQVNDERGCSLIPLTPIRTSKYSHS